MAKASGASTGPIKTMLNFRSLARNLSRFREALLSIVARNKVMHFVVNQHARRDLAQQLALQALGCRQAGARAVWFTGTNRKAHRNGVDQAWPASASPPVTAGNALGVIEAVRVLTLEVCNVQRLTEVRVAVQHHAGHALFHRR